MSLALRVLPRAEPEAVVGQVALRDDPPAVRVEGVREEARVGLLPRGLVFLATFSARI